MEEKPKHFIDTIIQDDLKSGKHDTVITRFPPEPNGYLHIGHAKSICLNFGLAETYNGKCNLRFDDTNPIKEEAEYVKSIIEDVQWLGFEWNELLYASDYFQAMYDFAQDLIQKDKAYVCELTPDEIRATRGSLKEPGQNSPHRNRPVEESVDLFQRMKNGEFPNGSMTLRAKIDMLHPNLNMRDPIIYRILHASHHRTGTDWCVYPMYDWAHGLEDSIEKITHSLCTLEFEDHRPLYDWFLLALGVYKPQQIEFARLNVGYTLTSKRKLMELVEEGHVTGWDDPRMPTISGMRRRGFSPEAIRAFSDKVGLAKRDTVTDMALLEFCVRDDLNKSAARVMGVLNPLKVVITNYPEDQVEELEAINNPEDPEMGKRKISFSRELYVEQNDFMEDPPRKFFRLGPGREVRLRYAYFITCNDVIKDEDGNVVELHCTYDPETKGGSAPDGRRVKGTIHWVSAEHAIDATVRLVDRLFTVEDPLAQENDFHNYINPDSMVELKNCKVEPEVKSFKPETRFQFERLGYFTIDRWDSDTEDLVINRTVTLRDSWAKKNRK
ncbi:MAG: glutamine--tRNA ligase/YqeY domain fusion protein [Candidatus Marinimicrobia bacterium]|nr:glutamine--tRNA ligase/YqeY domain fusion protein [Candidatus Neomarinimicrobiota bacterium]